MKTAELNEYIFTKIVAEEARIARRDRQRIMEEAGIPDDEVINTPLLPGDIRAGFENIEMLRLEVLRARKESLAESGV